MINFFDFSSIYNVDIFYENCLCIDTIYGMVNMYVHICMGKIIGTICGSLKKKMISLTGLRENIRYGQHSCSGI